jgi:hypothetical protein
MKVSSGALLLLVASLTLFAPSVHAQTAGQMAADCAPYRHALRLSPRPGGGSVVEAPGANANSNFCWGSFALLQQMVALQSVGAVTLYRTTLPTTRFCLPPSIERLDLVKAFLQYVDDHGAVANQPFAAALLTVLSQSYPCAGTS